MTAPAGAVAATPDAPGCPFAPGCPGAPRKPCGPVRPFTFQVTLRSPFLHVEASRSSPFVAPFLAAQAVIVPGAAARSNAPNAEALSAPATVTRQTVAATFGYVTRGIASNLTPRPAEGSKGWEGRGESLGGERAGELAALAHAELAVHVAQVPLHRLDGDEQVLRDLAVAHTARGHAGDAPLAGGEGIDTSRAGAARPGPRRHELRARLRGDRHRAEAVGQLEALAQWLAGLLAPAEPPHRAAEQHECARQLEARGRRLQHRDGVAVELEALLAAGHEPGGHERDADRPGRAEAAARRELLARQLARLLHAPEVQ